MMEFFGLFDLFRVFYFYYWLQCCRSKPTASVFFFLHYSFRLIYILIHCNFIHRTEVQLHQHVAWGQCWQEQLFWVVAFKVSSKSRISRSCDYMSTFFFNLVIPRVRSIWFGSHSQVTSPLHLDAIFMFSFHSFNFKIPSLRGTACPENRESNLKLIYCYQQLGYHVCPTVRLHFVRNDCMEFSQQLSEGLSWVLKFPVAPRRVSILLACKSIILVD